MKTDMQLKTDVSDELACNPAIDAAAIGVAVHEGVVTLTGQLNTFAEKHAAERAVRRVAGVRGIAIDLDVKLVAQHKRSDAEIAEVATRRCAGSTCSTRSRLLSVLTVPVAIAAGSAILLVAFPACIFGCIGCRMCWPA